MQARDVMSADVVTVGPQDSVLHAIRLMLQHKISGMPVVDASGALIGMVTEGDFLRRAEIDTQPHRPRWIEFLMGPGRLAEDYVHASGRKISEVMTRYVHVVSGETPLSNVVALMERQRIRRVPVLSGKTLIGIMTRTDLLRAVAAAVPKSPARAEDDAIHDAFLAELKKQPWAPVLSVDAVVEDGVVTLKGAVLDDRQRDALKVLAENLSGVKGVVDQLVWIEPNSGAVIAA